MRPVALGFSCNNACIFCAQGELRASDAAQDPELRAQALGAAIAAITPAETVAFVGGEPTIHGDLPAWIAAAHARGAARIVVQTNGRRLAYRAYARELAGASSRLTLDVALHGSTAPMHDYHTSVPGSFQQTVQGLRNARAEGLRVGVTTVITRSNFRHLGEIVRVARACGASAVRFALAAPHGRAGRDADRVIPALDMVKPHLVAAIGDARQLGLAVQWDLGDVGALDGLVEPPRGEPEGARFAGIGEVEPAATAAAPAAPAASRRQLHVLGRPVPARAEVRAPVKRTGAELREIFPTLFDDGGSARQVELRPQTPVEPSVPSGGL
jgi:pyruvate-formate lyase-activating enzyme